VGDIAAAAALVETYGTKIDPELYAEVTNRQTSLKLSASVGFVNPKYTLVKGAAGQVIDVKISYDEGAYKQRLRYSREYSFLPLINE
jgi:dipeptidyl-peptidase-3